mgnify:CR=1 FL=1
MIFGMRRKWRFAFGLAVFNDFLDLTSVGSIPVVGDLLDVGTSLALWKTLGTRKTMPTILEFVPGLDYLPIYTMTVSWAYLENEKVEGLNEDGMIDVEVN